MERSLTIKDISSDCRRFATDPPAFGSGAALGLEGEEATREVDMLFDDVRLWRE